jgi:DNA topoisomerase-3
LDNYPCIPTEFRVKPIPRKASPQAETCLQYIKPFFERADWLINATDPDREGETIFAYVYDLLQSKKPWKRAWLSDLTDTKIVSAFENLLDSSQVLPLQKAGRARGIADWLIGINLTIAMTKKYGTSESLLTLGRVQTPTLALVVDREKMIRTHKKVPFWKVQAVFSSATQPFEAEYDGENFDTEIAANAILSACNGQNGIVKTKEVKKRKVSVPLLFNTTGLQILASEKLGWEAERTEKVMQALYLAKLMSYPRTSTEHLTVAMQDEVRQTIEKLLAVPEYKQYSLPQTEWQEFTKRHFDDSKVGSHTAIIPTLNVPHSLVHLTDDEKLLYDLLAKSLIRLIYPKAELADTTLAIDVNSNIFKAKGSAIAVNGWYTVDAMPGKKGLPDIAENTVLSGQYNIKKGETEPPKRYTEATLLSAMELAGQNIEDEEARTLMKLQKKGLGTDATRVQTLKTLFANGYIEKKGKALIPTEKGIFMINTLPIEELKSADITGDWERTLGDIADGKAQADDFVQSIVYNTKNWFTTIKNSTGERFISAEEKLMVCPFCGNTVRKHDWGYGCVAYKDGCKFSLRNEIAGKKITQSQVLMLLSSGKTAVITGFTKKNGDGTFDAALKVNKAEKKIDFDFPNNNG